MLIACVRALFETDFKIIALSILNQLGIIFLSLGLGNFSSPNRQCILLEVVLLILAQSVGLYLMFK